MFDVAVVGAGAVGLACARELSRRGRSTIVLERHGQFGVETSSRNSEVVHAGIYYPPGSLKARFCVEGNRELGDYCARHGIPLRRCGKLIVAVASTGEPALDGLAKRAEQNGVPELRRVDRRELARLEPCVKATGALLSPTSGIVDSHGFMAAMEAEARAAGAEFAYRVNVLGVERRGDQYVLELRDADGELLSLPSDAVVNAAGLEADRLAAQVGIDIDERGYRQHFWAGRYYRLAGDRRQAVRHLVYPVPEPELVGLGIHVTLDMAGELKLGPDACYLPQRQADYAFRDDARAEFAEAVSRYLPGIREQDLRPDQVGIRPKLQAPGDPFRDFVVQEESAAGLAGWVNLIGIESPGLTCALVLARHVADELEI